MGRRGPAPTGPRCGHDPQEFTTSVEGRVICVVCRRLAQRRWRARNEVLARQRVMETQRRRALMLAAIRQMAGCDYRTACELYRAGLRL